jgi:hypothetical protein
MMNARAGWRLAAPAGLIAIVLAAPAFALQQTAPSPLTLDDYIARLDTLESALTGQNGRAAPPALLSQLAAGLPEVWHVRASEQTFEVPTRDLSRQLRTWLRTRDPAGRDRLVQAVQVMRLEAARFNDPVRDAARDRSRLAEVLSRPEFRGIHGPTWKERLEQRALQLLRALFLRLVPSTVPLAARLAAYALILAAIIVAALAFARLAARGTSPPPSAVEPAAPSARNWRAWLAQAREAASGARWRDAVHASYWCAVLFLETKGAWRGDRSRTPREYLQLLPPASEDRAAFAPLSAQFEAVWYGGRTADAGAFADAMSRLHALGCPQA